MSALSSGRGRACSWCAEFGRRASGDALTSGKLPCLTCRERSAAERALEEVAAVFVGAMHGEPAPRPDGRLLRFLPRGCCRQPRVKADIEALVA
jgi:hypothetical protein